MRIRAQPFSTYHRKICSDHVIFILTSAESRDSLVVANLALKQQPWVAIFCKAPPNPLDKMATREHEDEMIRVKECLQGHQ